jgi:hypothetical protein
MEERRKSGARDDFLEKFYKLEVAVDRLTEHEKLDKPRYEQWHDETLGRLAELEKLRGELSLTAMHNVTAGEVRDAARKRVDEIVNGKLGALDERQRAIERTLWRASGAATVIISLVVIIVNLAVKHF